MFRITFPLALFVVTTGCAYDAPQQSFDPAPVAIDGDDLVDVMSPQTRAVLEGQMVGTMPGQGELDREVTEGSFRRTRNWIDLDVESTTDDWTLLVGSMYIPDLEPGATAVPEVFDIRGCGGMEPQNFDFYDEPAVAVEVTEHLVGPEGDARLGYTVVATFADGGVIEANLVVPLPED